MTLPLKSGELDRISYKPELSPSIIYRELERYHIETIIDPLSSTSNAAGYFKLQDIRIIGNDLALYAFVKGKALWENNTFTIPKEVSDLLTDSEAKLPALYHYKTLGGDWLTDEERGWLEYWRKVITDAKDEYIRALSETAVCLVIDYWITSRRFGVTADWTPPGLLGFYINHVNRGILDNQESNEMWRADPRELVEKSIADILFINPPPLKGYAAFGVREHITESWLRGMSDFPLDKVAPKGVVGCRFTSVGDYMEGLSDLMENAEHIPIWTFVMSNRQPFTRLEFKELMKSLGRNMKEIDLKIARHFFSLRAPDSVVIAVR